MTEEEAYDLKMLMIEDLHDPNLSEALARWASGMEVKESKLAVSCLRMAGLCIAQQLNRAPAKNDCVIIESFEQYLHYYVHAAQRALKEDKEK